MLGAPLGGVSDEKRLDSGRDGLRAFEESVVASASNHDELTLWDRIRDRGRRRNRNGVIFAVDDKGRDAMLPSFMGNACSPKSAKSRCAVSRFLDLFSVSRYCVLRATWRSLKNGT